MIFFLFLLIQSDSPELNNKTGIMPHSSICSLKCPNSVPRRTAGALRRCRRGVVQVSPRCRAGVVQVSPRCRRGVVQVSSRDFRLTHHPRHFTAHYVIPCVWEVSPRCRPGVVQVSSRDFRLTRHSRAPFHRTLCNPLCVGGVAEVSSRCRRVTSALLATLGRHFTPHFSRVRQLNPHVECARVVRVHQRCRRGVVQVSSRDFRTLFPCAAAVEPAR